MSVKKAIKIYARLKPTDNSICKYEVDKHINDDGTTDDILILNSGASADDDGYLSNSASVNRPDSYRFRFSKVFDGVSSQDSLFDEMCRPVLESAMQGYNSTLFAYGQTGSGKTYTMTGSRQHWKNRGIIPRSLSYIFDKFSDLTNQGYIASAFLSYLEIYNENGYDLLHPGFSSGRIEDLKKVQLLEDSQQQIHMKNLTVHPIKSEDEAMQLLYLGDHNRIIAETPMNEASTRSHCIFTIHLNIREANSSTVRRSKVHLVDLAGSERLANSQSTGQLFHEARHINLALHYLEQVIVALGEAHRSHIPYRNSMMTSILRDSLGGNCMTSMVATLSLEHRNIPETLSTCRFSQRVALVQNAATLNEETDPMLLIAQLKLENKRLKDIITNSSIKTMDANTEPLSQEEVQDCWKLVEKFMSDSDEEAILPVAPDMRMVQTCFRCLKMAVQMNKEEIVGIARAPTAAAVIARGSSDFVERSPDKYTQELTREQLVDVLRVRDAEIDVLTKMLRPDAMKGKKAMGYGLPPSLNRANKFEDGDGPQQQFQQQMKIYADEDNDMRGRIVTRGQWSNAKQPMQQQQPIQTGRLPQLSRKSDKERASSRGSAGSAPGDIDNQANTTQGLSGGYEDLFDPDSLFIEGLSDAKKRALDIFVRSYKSREKLKRGRENMMTKRAEVESIETQLRRNHANLNNLKVVLMSSDGGGEEEDMFMREAVDVQTMSIQKQERQLARSKEDLRKMEETLKGQYAQLMSDFESFWVSRKEQRPPLMGVRDIPSEVDFALGASAASTSTAVALHQDPSMYGAMEENGKKPITEVTKSIAKGVGGENSFNSFMLQSKSTINPKLPPDMQFSVSSPAYASSTPRASKSMSSARRDKLSGRGKHAPTNTPRHSGGRSSPTSKPSYQSPSKGSKVPPGTPANSLYQTIQSEKLNDPHKGEYTSNFSFGGASTTASTAIDLRNETAAPHQNYDDDDDDEEELLKELPMTGDETIDQEILSFFRTRQAVFKQINSDKTTRVGNKTGETTGGGGSVLANYHQFS